MADVAPTELKILWGWAVYKDAAPTVLKTERALVVEDVHRGWLDIAGAAGAAADSR